MAPIDWILCEDRLPELHEVVYDGERWEESEDVLVFAKTVYGDTGYGIARLVADPVGDAKGETTYWNGYVQDSLVDSVYTWMPIPKYEGEDE